MVLIRDTIFNNCLGDAEVSSAGADLTYRDLSELSSAPLPVSPQLELLVGHLCWLLGGLPCAPCMGTGMHNFYDRHPQAAAAGAGRRPRPASSKSSFRIKEVLYVCMYVCTGLSFLWPDSIGLTRMTMTVSG